MLRVSTAKNIYVFEGDEVYYTYKKIIDGLDEIDEFVYIDSSEYGKLFLNKSQIISIEYKE